MGNKAYKDCLDSMYGLRRFGIKLGLSTIRNILSALGNPQNEYSCIHVAGTNGKGSVASALASILQEAGYKTGLFTSPHLVTFNERIQINQHLISNKHVVELYNIVKNVHQGGSREPTFFEFSTAMALYEFSKEKVDWAVIETGMGGRLDATNIIKPAISVITNISIEHKKYLGNTIEKIAGEKGGIIKRGIPVIAGAKQKNAINVLKNIAAENKAPFYLIGESFKTRKNKNGTFTYHGMGKIWPDMQTGLSGFHQIENASLVLAACEILGKRIDLPVEKIRAGLFKNKWPGRLEVVSTSPYIILDGAHNLDAARTLSKFLSKEFYERKITIITGMLDDKPYPSMLKSILSGCSRAILTKPLIDRALEPETLYEASKEIVKNIKIIPDVKSAIDYAVKTASKDEVICITGSLYVVGEAKALFSNLTFQHI
ncbi:MAG: bifunctional folylpolyglutamate synthase/dihydrofolate synthase [Desulfobacteraceae bacterium]|nr:MAG: bifunctional folylpolyglutamate synthase/dihydrofolate synthase [Desulfobacteraceae bacterium]